MVHVDAWLRKEKLENRASLILQVHDELVYEIEEKLVPSVVPKIRAIMEQVVPKEASRGVPILVEASVGDNWGEMEKLEDSSK